MTRDLAPDRYTRSAVKTTEEEQYIHDSFSPVSYVVEHYVTSPEEDIPVPRALHIHGFEVFGDMLHS